MLPSGHHGHHDRSSEDSAEVFFRTSAQSIAGEELRQLRLGRPGAHGLGALDFRGTLWIDEDHMYDLFVHFYCISIFAYLFYSILGMYLHFFLKVYSCTRPVAYRCA